MKLRNILSRSLSLLLALCSLLSLLPTTGLFSIEAEAAESWDVDGDGTLSILTIGNSFSDDAMEYVYNIAKNLGINSIYLGNLYIPSCTLATHWNNAKNNSAAYTYRKNTAGSWSSTGSFAMDRALQERSWDYISMQQASPSSGDEGTYNSDLTNLISHVKGKAPNAKLVWHMTWAYQSGSSKLTSSIYSSQTDMYNRIVSCVTNKIKTNSNFSIVIPNGTAIQNVRSSYIGDNVTRDGYHLNKWFGRYVAGLMFVKSLTGLSIDNISYKPSNVPKAWRKVAIEAVNNAYAQPLATKASQHTNYASDEDYVLIKPQIVMQAYWHPGTDTYNKLIKDASNSLNYAATNPRFTKSTLPTGSIVWLNNGTYRFRPDHWRTNAKQTDTRAGVVSATKTVVTDEWWMYDVTNSLNYAYRSFNIFKQDKSSLDGVSSTTIHNNFKIYIPIEYSPEGKTADQVLAMYSGLPAPVPNNKFIDPGEKTIDGFNYKKVLLVNNKNHDYDLSDQNFYCWNPTVPRMFGTWHASKVQVKTDSGSRRVYGADHSWYLYLDWKSTIKKSGNNLYYTVGLQVPANNLSGKNYRYISISDSTHDGKPNGLKLSSGNTSEIPDSKYNRPYAFVNHNNNRIHFTVTDTSGGATALRTNLVFPSNEEPYFTVTSSKVANTPVKGVYAAFEMYEVLDNYVNPEPLYNAIINAKQYLTMDTAYCPGYQDFLDKLSTAITEYKTYNNKNMSNVESRNGAQSTLNTCKTNLENAINNICAQYQVKALKIPFVQQKNIDSASNINGNSGEGTYFIVREYNGNMDVVLSLLDKKSLTSNGSSFDAKRVKFNASQGTIGQSDLTNAITLRYIEGSTNGYSMQFEGDSFLLNASNSTTAFALGNATRWNLTIARYKGVDDTAEFRLGSGNYLYCDAAFNNVYNLKAWDASKDERFGLTMYQCSPATLELYRALKYIYPYLNNAEGQRRYSDEIYTEFLNYVYECVNEYNKHNNSTHFSNTNTKAALEKRAARLREYADILTKEDQTISYIDIPTEILDFRSDLLMFEFDDSGSKVNAYGFVTDRTNAGNLMPGTVPSGQNYRTGLTLPNLVDGRLVYKPETIRAVAQLIMEDATTADRISRLTNNNADYNEYFQAKIATIKSSNALGDMNSTIAKTEAVNGQKYNGCLLLWENVTTAHDLAYYAMNNMWREVPGDDTLSSAAGNTYNIRVQERDTLRLYKEANSKHYEINSDYYSKFDGFYMYNTMPRQARPNTSGLTKFTPVDNLGFETGWKETDAGTHFKKNGWVDELGDHNFGYTLHAYGSFVYYEDQDLYFEFTGDDDVYFYINDEIVLDLGGAHSAVSGSVTLNNIAAAHGIEEGDICSFDMFYAERHTTGSNMQLKTNIKIVDTETLTTEDQHLEISGTESMVDPKTGIGPSLIDNTVLNVGDVVSYGFNLANVRQVPVYDLSFIDESIGTYVSHEGIVLTEPEMTNGVETTLADITLFYRSFVHGKAHDSEPIPVSYEEIRDLIMEKNAAKERFPLGSYSVKVSSNEELMELMKIGIPINCRLTIYGFKRMTVAADQPYTNTLETLCRYLPNSTSATEADERIITGSASRILQVPDIEQMPTVARLSFVVDHGKPLSINLSEITSLVSVQGNVKLAGLAGLATDGFHGSFLKRAPAKLNCETASTVGASDIGSFYRTGTTIEYRPSKVLNEMQKVYAVFDLDGCLILDNNGKSTTYEYVLAEIRIIPATVMYYETDFDADNFDPEKDDSVFIDFGENDTIEWGEKSNNCTVKKENGFLTGTLSGTDPYVRMNAASCTLNHIFKANDVVKLRIKSDAFIGQETGIQVFFMTETNADPIGQVSTIVENYKPSGDWQIITLDEYEAKMIEGMRITGIRIDPLGNNNLVASGTFAVDWVYLGQENVISEGSAFSLHTTDSENAWTIKGTPSSTKQQPKFSGNAATYGYDASYASGTGDSNGSSLFVMGAGVPLFDNKNNPIIDEKTSYTEASFSFYGTGFDIISRTDKDQGALRVMVYDADGNWEKNITVINKNDHGLKLRQIPVISVDDLAYGLHTVRIFVNAAYDFGDDGDKDIFGGGLDRGGEFYFDAVRIYSAVNTESADAESAYVYSVYQAHGEADPSFIEIRKQLLKQESLASGDKIEGAIYLAAKGENDVPTIDDYAKVGPNNEVYLDKGDAVAFCIEAGVNIPTSVDIGAKSISSVAANMIATGTPNAPTALPDGTGVSIATNTEMYYSVNVSGWTTEGNKSYAYITVRNTGEGILSLTKIKLGYDNSDEKEPVSLFVNRKMVNAIENGGKPILDEDLTFGAQLYLENDLSMAFRVKEDKLTAYDISSACLVVERDVYATGAKEATVETMTIRDYTIEDGRLIFSYPGIAAAQMNDAIRATIHIENATGQEYVSPVMNTSVATYLNGLLTSSASDTKLVTLIIDMLNYGAAAQVYFDRHADAPVNEAFESFRTYASYASADFKSALENLATTENAEDKSGKLNLSLDLGTRIGILFKVTVPTDVNVDDVTLVVTDAEGNVLETLAVAGNGTDNKGRYLVNFYGSTSRDMRRVVYATAYANGEAITGTYAYSISTYTWGIQENATVLGDPNLVLITRMMMLYGDSAEAYFA